MRHWARLEPNYSELPKETAMILYAALDVAIEKTALCIVDREGAVVLETDVASDPDALADCLAPYHLNSLASGWRPGHYRNGSCVAWSATASGPCSWKRVMCAPRYRPASPKQTARTLAASPTLCAWVASAQCSSKAWTRANTVLC